MRKNLVFIVLLLWTCASAFAQQILPVTGTFINLPYQDVRNKYTNPEGIDMTDPSVVTGAIEDFAACVKQFGEIYGA